MRLRAWGPLSVSAGRPLQDRKVQLPLPQNQKFLPSTHLLLIKVGASEAAYWAALIAMKKMIPPARN